MYNLTDKEKIDFIIKKSEELNVTAYEYGNNTEISILGASNILNRTSQNPRAKNLNIMLQYLESKVVGSEYKQEAKLTLVKEPEDEATYKEDDLETIIFKRVYKKLEKNFTDIEKRLSKLESKI